MRRASGRATVPSLAPPCPPLDQGRTGAGSRLPRSPRKHQDSDRWCRPSAGTPSSRDGTAESGKALGPGEAIEGGIGFDIGQQTLLAGEGTRVLYYEHRAEQQIAPAGPVPKMVVRIDDRQHALLGRCQHRSPLVKSLGSLFSRAKFLVCLKNIPCSNSREFCCNSPKIIAQI